MAVRRVIGTRPRRAAILVAAAIIATVVALSVAGSGARAICVTNCNTSSSPPPPPPPATDPGGSETTDVSVPPPAGRYFGFDYEEAVTGPNQPLTTGGFANYARLAGANTARVTLDWKVLEPTQGKWDEGAWARFANIYNTLLAAGIKPVLTIGFAPIWARDSGAPRTCTDPACRYPPAQSMLGAWARFAAQVVKRFPQARAIEIWNEPNLPNFWRSGPDPRRFATVEAWAYDAIKNVDPSMPVLAGGININQRYYQTYGTTAIPLRDFLDAAYAAPASLKHYMDAISLHTSTQELNYSTGSSLAKAFDQVRSTEAKYGDSGRSIWITEDGITTSAGGSDARTQRQQADGLLRQYRRFMTMPDVKAMLINALVESPAFAWNNFNRGYGVRLYEPPGFPPKLAFCAFADRANANPPSGCPPVWQPTM